MNNDIDKLIAVLSWCTEHPDEVEKRRLPEEVFREILDRGRPLTSKQSDWIRDVHAKLFDEPEYRNDWSAGKVPEGRPVPDPPAFKYKPTKPPPRRPTE